MSRPNPFESTMNKNRMSKAKRDAKIIQRFNEILYSMRMETLPENPYRPTAITYVFSESQQIRMEKGESFSDFVKRVEKAIKRFKQK